MVRYSKVVLDFMPYIFYFESFYFCFCFLILRWEKLSLELRVNSSFFQKSFFKVSVKIRFFPDKIAVIFCSPRCIILMSQKVKFDSSER